MGFGLLLCAYFLLTFMSVAIGDFVFLTYVLGAMVTLSAVAKLKDYNPRFAYLYPPALLYCLIALYYLVITLADVFLWDLPLRTEAATTVVSIAQFVAEVSYAVIALWASAELAASVGLAKHRTRAWRNVVFVGIFAVAQILLWTIPALATAGNQALLKVLTLYQLVVYLFVAFHFYTCFSSICPQGEEFGKPSKPSRFKFINSINQKLDEKNEQARLEYEQRMADENKKYSAKNNNRHHKKKK